jgi:hypothetical protein
MYVIDVKDYAPEMAGRKPVKDTLSDDDLLRELGIKFSKFDDNLPGGRLYGNPNRSPGGALSAPGTPSPAFTSERPGNQFFGGELAERQLEMARTGERGATMVYLTPDEYLALAGAAPENPEQEVYDATLSAGYKFSGMPSLVVSGYAGNVRATASDGSFAAVTLLSTLPPVPPGATRLYRAEPRNEVVLPEWIRQAKEADGSLAAQGRWFVADPSMLDFYVADQGGTDNSRLRYVDIPTEELDAHRVANNPKAASFSRDPENEFFVPPEMAKASRPLAPPATIPVVLYPKSGESLGLVTALEGPDGARVPWPHEGRAENFPEVRGPRYSVGSPEFRRWFGESKVVGPDGAPLVVYRGDFPNRTSFADTGGNRIGGNVFFSSDPKIGRDYVRNDLRSRGSHYMIDPATLGEADGLYRAYLALENPLVVDAGGNGWNDVPAPQQIKDEWGDPDKTIQIDELAQWAREQGHDGLIVRDVMDQHGDGDQYVAFEPTQIKSAVNNNGQYDAANPDIRYSLNAPVRQRASRPRPRGRCTTSCSSAPKARSATSSRTSVAAEGQAVRQDGPSIFERAPSSCRTRTCRSRR